MSRDITDTLVRPVLLLSVLMYHLQLQPSTVPRSLLCHHQAAPIMHPDSLSQDYLQSAVFYNNISAASETSAEAREKQE